MKFLTWTPLLPGRYRIITLSDSPIDFIINRPGHDKHYVPLIPILVAPRGITKVPFKWKEFVQSKQKAEEAKLVVNGKKTEEPKYIGIQTFYKSDKVIGTREESVDLMEIETHPDSTRVTSSDGVVLEVITIISVEIKNPLKAFALGSDFLIVIYAKVLEAIREKASVKSFDQMLQVGAKTVTEITIPVPKKDANGNAIKDDNGQYEMEDIFFIDAINKDSFLVDNDFSVKSVVIDTITVALESQDVLNSKEEIVKEDNKVKTEEAKTKQEEQKVKRVTLNNNAEIDFRTKNVEIETQYYEKNTENIVKINKSKNEGFPSSMTHYMPSYGGEQGHVRDMIKAREATKEVKSKPKQNSEEEENK